MPTIREGYDIVASVHSTRIADRWRKTNYPERRDDEHITYTAIVNGLDRVFSPEEVKRPEPTVTNSQSGESGRFIGFGNR